MSTEIPNGLSNIEIRYRKAFLINGELSEEQKMEIKDIVNGWGKFLFCSNSSDDTKFLVIFKSAYNHQDTWDLIEKNYPEYTLHDAGFYSIGSETHSITSFSSSLIDSHISREQINKSRDFLRETLGIQVDNPFLNT